MQLRDRDVGFMPVGSVSPRNGCRPFGEIAGTDFDSDWNSLFDPLPVFHTAAKIASIDLDDHSVFSVAKFAQEAAILSTASSTAARVSSFGVIAMITACAGEIRGGSMSPSSSPCAMMSVPIIRVVIPQLVVHAYSSSPLRD